MRPRGDEYRARRELHLLLRLGVLEDDRARAAPLVRDDLERREVLDEADPFLERLDHFLVVQAVRRRVLQPLAIDDRDPAPVAHEAREVGRAALAARGLALG